MNCPTWLYNCKGSSGTSIPLILCAIIIQVMQAVTIVVLCIIFARKMKVNQYVKQKYKSLICFIVQTISRAVWWAFASFDFNTQSIQEIMFEIVCHNVALLMTNLTITFYIHDEMMRITDSYYQKNEKYRQRIKVFAILYFIAFSILTGAFCTMQVIQRDEQMANIGELAQIGAIILISTLHFILQGAMLFKQKHYFLCNSQEVKQYFSVGLVFITLSAIRLCGCVMKLQLYKEQPIRASDTMTLILEDLIPDSLLFVALIVQQCIQVFNKKNMKKIDEESEEFTTLVENDEYKIYG